MEKITIKDVATKAGVSISTVSKVFNNSNEISADTREKILQIAREIGYSPNQIARSLRTENTKVIGLIVPDSSNLYYAELLKGVQDIASREGYAVIVGNTNEQEALEQKQIEAFQSLQVAGILAAPVNEENYEKLKVPVVFVSRCSSAYRERYSYTITNDFKGATLATEYLARQGKKDIFFLSGPRQISIAAERRDGYCSSLKKNGIPYNPAYIYWDNLTMEDGYQKFWQIHKLYPGKKGFFCSSDNVAIGVLAGAREAKLQIPEEVGIVGYDNIEILQFLDYPLTTISQAKYEIGAQGGKILLERISHNYEYRYISHITLVPELVVRKT